MIEKTPVKVICPKCGSDEIHKDAAAGWNDELQQWELVSVHDCETCAVCGHEGDFMGLRVSISLADSTVNLGEAS